MATGTRPSSVGLETRAEAVGGAVAVGGAMAVTPEDIGSPINAMSNFFGMEEVEEEDVMETGANGSQHSRIDHKVVTT